MENSKRPFQKISRENHSFLPITPVAFYITTNRVINIRTYLKMKNINTKSLANLFKQLAKLLGEQRRLRSYYIKNIRNDTFCLNFFFKWTLFTTTSERTKATSKFVWQLAPSFLYDLCVLAFGTYNRCTMTHSLHLHVVNSDRHFVLTFFSQFTSTCHHTSYWQAEN